MLRSIYQRINIVRSALLNYVIIRIMGCIIIKDIIRLKGCWIWWYKDKKCRILNNYEYFIIYED
jgi:hypothetical protein